MVVTKVRKSLLTVLMALTIMAGLITGFAHVNATSLTSSTGVHSSLVRLATPCPPPPYVC